MCLPALRHAFTALSALSLLLCVAVGVLGVRSYFVWDRAFVCGAVAEDAQNVLGISFARGQLWLSVVRTQGFSYGTTPREGANLIAEDLDRAGDRETRPGFRLTKEARLLTYDYTALTPPRQTTWSAAFPHWSIAAPATLLSGVWITRFRRRRRRRAADHCANCGYDLRASPGRCPESGTSRGE